jgi:diacylglycerol O-acyltransferase / wax synthase
MTASRPSGKRSRKTHTGAEPAAESPMPAASEEPMSAVDHAWLEMDEPDNPMIVSALMALDDVRAPKRVIRLLIARLLEYPRFRQRVDTTQVPPRWIDDGELHLGYHVHLDKRGHTASEHELAALIGAELSQPLDRAMPLWRATVYPRPRRGLMILFRAHHAIADGVAQLRLLLQLTDQAPHRPTADVTAPKTAHRHGPLAAFIDTLESADQILERARELLREDLRHPSRVAEQVREGLSIARSVARVLRAPRHAPECFQLPLSGHRLVAWSGGIAFSQLYALSRTEGVTVNDIFLTALGGAFGRYLHDRGSAPAPGTDLGISIPVNLRADRDGVFGNSFGLVLLDLPIAQPDWRTRLHCVSARMAERKRSPEARAVLAGLEVAGHLPPAAEKRIVNWLGDKACAVVSNLPGPRRHLRVAGARISRIVFWPPQTSHVGIGVSLLSYAGEITVGVNADTALVPQPQRLVDALLAELGVMLARTPKRGLRRAAAR